MAAAGSSSAGGGGSSSSNPPPSSTTSTAAIAPPPPPPKILLTKPASVPVGSAVPKLIRGGGGAEDEPVVLRSRAPSLSSLNLLSDSWDFHTDRILPFLTENSDFTVIGVIGPPGVGKSTILNELYGFDGSSPGMLPPFTTQSEETRAMARHCTTGIELRISTERLILLDTQPIFSPSVLAEMMRPDGSSSISVLNGENLSADLAHELMGIQLGVFLASICHVLLVVSEGIHDFNMWHLMLTVDLLKHGIPDPSLLTPTYSQANPGQVKENKDNLQELNEEYFASPVFVHTNSDFLGTKFAIYDSQPPFNGAKPSNSRTSRRFGRKQVFPRATGGGTFEIGQVSYKFNLLKSKGPRRMSCTVQCPSSKESIDQPQKSGEIENHAVHSKCMVLKNKSPRWHEHLQCWCLNFHERVTVASVKNFQLVASVDPSQPDDRGDEDTVLLQFEKVGDDLFTMDYREPLSALRASDRL